MTTSPHVERRIGTGTASTDAWTWILAVLALGNLANGVWMLARPIGWFHDLPAGVPDFGPLNEHFVRDIGAAFVVQGAALLWAAFVPAWRVPLVAPVTLFSVMHAAAHVYDTARGLVGPAHWLIDLPAVYLPALAMTVLLWLLARARTQSSRKENHHASHTDR
jgi:hypothetical protein